MKLDLTHDMYLPSRRRSSVEPKAVEANPNGSRAEQEAWMRKRQAEKKYPVRPVRIEAIIRAACRECSISRERLLRGDRDRLVTRARAKACCDLRAFGLSYPEIASALEMHNHTSVRYHCKRQQIGVHDYDSLLECLTLEFRRVFPDHPETDPQNMIQLLAATATGAK